jgi:hypothetical protein
VTRKSGGSVKFKYLGDIARLVESHPHLWDRLEAELNQLIDKPLKFKKAGFSICFKS